MNQTKIKTITKMALLAALVCLATFIIKVPTINGYTHIGDGLIFISVILLGKKNGAVAGGIGAALSDMLGGYIIWVIPTLVIKMSMAFLMGLVMEKIFVQKKWGWILGAAIGGALQVAAYALVEGAIYGPGFIVLSIPPNIIQTIVGILIAAALNAALKFPNINSR